jgi:hypothetical protein
MMRIYLHRNKILIQYDDDFEMIICKTISDGVRFYNKLQEMISEKQIKYIFFMGKIKQKSKLMAEWDEKIIKKTGWNRIKVYKTSTRST